MANLAQLAVGPANAPGIFLDLEEYEFAAAQLAVSCACLRCRTSGLRLLAIMATSSAATFDASIFEGLIPSYLMN